MLTRISEGDNTSHCRTWPVLSLIALRMEAGAEIWPRSVMVERSFFITFYMITCKKNHVNNFVKKLPHNFPARNHYFWYSAPILSTAFIQAVLVFVAGFL